MPIPTITLNNIKGGVAKTTTTLNVGYGLARKGKSVLLVDMDPQSNLTYSCTGVLSEAPENSLYEVMIPEEPRPMKEIIVPTKQQNVLLAPGSLALSSADLALALRPGRERILQYALEEFAQFCVDQHVHIDYIIIDTPPNLGLLSVNALVACGNTDDAGGYIIPVAADVYATIGISHLRSTIAGLRKNLRIPIRQIGAVATIVDNTADGSRHLANICEEFGPLMFETMIPRNVKVKEANNVKILYDHAPSSAGAQAYMRLVEEVIARVR